MLKDDKTQFTINVVPAEVFSLIETSSEAIILETHVEEIAQLP